MDISVLIAMGLFVLSHIVVAGSHIKPVLVRLIGQTGYLALYSLMSIGLMAWVIIALINADRLSVWTSPEWAHGFAAVFSLIAFVLIGSGGASPNPFSVSFRKGPYVLERPGVIGWVRHPVIWGLSLWGIAHIPANGDWPSLLLFGGSALFGVIGVFALEARAKAKFGPGWQQAIAARGHVDFNSMIGGVAGFTLWLGFLAGHPFLFDVDPLAVLLSQFQATG